MQKTPGSRLQKAGLIVCIVMLVSGVFPIVQGAMEQSLTPVLVGVAFVAGGVLIKALCDAIGAMANDMREVRDAILSLDNDEGAHPRTAPAQRAQRPKMRRG